MLTSALVVSVALNLYLTRETWKPWLPKMKAAFDWVKTWFGK